MSPQSRKKARRRKWRWAFLITLTLALVFIGPEAPPHVRAASLLLRFSSSDAPSGFATVGMVEVDEEPSSFLGPGGQVASKIYIPRGMPNAPGLIIAHGVHHLAIEEPRLHRFARAIASAGICVMTPALADIADYKITPTGAKTIGFAAKAHRERVGRSSVGVLGLSFAGGLAILAASDPRFAQYIAFVVAVGAHDDLERVLRFFATNEIDDPDGKKLKMQAHDYGALVLVYSYIGEFFAPEDIMVARDALRLQLWEETDKAKEAAAKLSDKGKVTIGFLFARNPEGLRRELLATIDRHKLEMAAVSPHSKMNGIRAPVFLLHGADDSVIPPTESLWLAHDAPPGSVRNTLVSPAIQHVELHGQPSMSEKFDIVHFMAQILEEAQNEPSVR